MGRFGDQLARGARFSIDYNAQQERQEAAEAARARQERMDRLNYGMVPNADLVEADPSGLDTFLSEIEPPDMQFGQTRGPEDDATNLPANLNLMTGRHNPIRPDAVLGPGGGGGAPRQPGIRPEAAMPAAYNPQEADPRQFGEALGGGSSLFRDKYQDVIPLDDEYSIVPEVTLAHQQAERDRMREQGELEEFIGVVGGMEEDLPGIDPRALELAGRFGGVDQAVDLVIDALQNGNDREADARAAEILRTDPAYAPYFGNIVTEEGAAETLLELQKDRFEENQLRTRPRRGRGGGSSGGGGSRYSLGPGGAPPRGGGSPTLEAELPPGGGGGGSAGPPRGGVRGDFDTQGEARIDAENAAAQVPPDQAGTILEGKLKEIRESGREPTFWENVYIKELRERAESDEDGGDEDPFAYDSMDRAELELLCSKYNDPEACRRL